MIEPDATIDENVVRTVTRHQIELYPSIDLIGENVMIAHNTHTLVERRGAQTTVTNRANSITIRDLTLPESRRLESAFDSATKRQVELCLSIDPIYGDPCLLAKSHDTDHLYLRDDERRRLRRRVAQLRRESQCNSS